MLVPGDEDVQALEQPGGPPDTVHRACNYPMVNHFHVNRSPDDAVRGEDCHVAQPHRAVLDHDRLLDHNLVRIDPFLRSSLTLRLLLLYYCRSGTRKSIACLATPSRDARSRPREDVCRTRLHGPELPHYEVVIRGLLRVQGRHRRPPSPQRRPASADAGQQMSLRRIPTQHLNP